MAATKLYKIIIIVILFTVTTFIAIDVLTSQWIYNLSSSTCFKLASLWVLSLPSLKVSLISLLSGNKICQAVLSFLCPKVWNPLLSEELCFLLAENRVGHQNLSARLAFKYQCYQKKVLLLMFGHR